MSKLFLHLLNISITAGWIVLVVVLLRFVLKKAPKWTRVVLWGLVALRLILPVSIESPLSLVPSEQTVSIATWTLPDTAVGTSEEGSAAQRTTAERVVFQTGFPALNSAINPTMKQSYEHHSTVSTVKVVAGWVWLAGAVAMLLYALISYLRLRHKVHASVRIEKGVYVCDEISDPFILGLIVPKIYLPSGMDEQTRAYVLAHERAHLKRFDHIWKPLGFLLLSVYWFNPLLWLAYILLCRDIELACDEKVVKELDDTGKAAYSEALVTASVSRRSIAACPLAFGETGVKSRVKSVLSYKKPAFWIILVALLLGIVTAVCFLTMPKKNKSEEADAAPKSAENMKVAYICTETGAFADTNINENIWTGLTAFAEVHNWTYSNQYFSDAPCNESDPEDIMKASERAIENGANVLICAGYNSFEPVDTLAAKYPDIQFLMIDHEQNGYVPKSPNVYCITFNINEAGYLAGYAAVAEGYRNLAYIGLGPYTQSEPFEQGVNEAAEKFGVSTDVRIINDRDTVFDKDKIAELYRTGTEVIYAPFVDWFAVLAASDTGGKVITVDHVNIDDNTDNFTVLCCTKRNVTPAVQMALETLWNNGGIWPQDCAGAQQVLGLKNGGVGLYTEPECWRFENFTSDAYYELLDSLLDYDVLESYNKKVDSSVVITQWLDYYSASNQIPWDEKKRIGIDAFYNVRFEWSSGSVEAIYNGTTHTLFTGMPIWNVFIADITRDGNPELCATVSFGSGIVDDHIVVYDYMNRQSYTLWDRGTFDYHLYTDNGALYVGKTQCNSFSSDTSILDTGTLMMHDGVLCCRWQSDSSFTSLNRELCASELYGEWLVEEEKDANGNVLYTFDVASTWKEYNFRHTYNSTVTYNETVPISSDYEKAFGHPVEYPYEVHDGYVYINDGRSTSGYLDPQTGKLELNYQPSPGQYVYQTLRRMGEDLPEADAEATPEPVLNTTSPFDQGQYHKTVPVGEVPEALRSVVEHDLFCAGYLSGGKLVPYADRVLSYREATDGDTTAAIFDLYDLYGNLLTHAEVILDPYQTVESAAATADSGIVFASGFNDMQLLDKSWASEHTGVVSYVVKLDANGRQQWKTALPNVNGYALHFCIERSGAYYFFGDLETPETSRPGVSSYTDLYLLKIGTDGSILKEQTYGGSDFDMLWTVNTCAEGFVMDAWIQSTDGDFPANSGWRIVVDPDLIIVEKQQIAVPRLADYVGTVDGKRFYDDDLRFNFYPDGHVHAILDYGTFYLIVSENNTGVYDSQPLVINSIWYLTETVYAAYDKQNNLLWKAAVDSSPDYDSIVKQYTSDDRP